MNCLAKMHVGNADCVKSLGCEMNCLAKMHVGNADCVKSFEKGSSVLTDAC